MRTTTPSEIAAFTLRTKLVGDALLPVVLKYTKEPADGAASIHALMGLAVSVACAASGGNTAIARELLAYSLNIHLKTASQPAFKAQIEKMKKEGK